MAGIVKTGSVITITLTPLEAKSVNWGISVWGAPQTMLAMQDWIDGKVRDYNSQQKENLVEAYVAASPAVKLQVKVLLGDSIEP